ncbi:Alpha/Beta hydrolase protein [Aspergillus venezuelensis]
MPNPIREDITTIDDTSYPYIFEQNVTITLKDNSGLVRCNVYRPKSNNPSPVLVTYGPYGKDIPYADFHPKSYSEVNPEHRSQHSAWETPDPAFWTSHGYAVVRADERGTGQSRGKLDTMSRETSEAFFDVVEWAAEQPWSSGKVGLLGISYYAGSQWRVGARQPKGLACMIPWEGMSDYYRDRCRHGGILSNAFIKFWWNRQVVSNQYGRPGRSARNWGVDTIEGDLDEKELVKNRQDQTIDNANNRFRDDIYYASKEYTMSDIQVPLLSVANWGGILLHLRGNVEGYTQAGSELKYLRFITGRHDLPFYYKEEVEVQRSFLDAFLKGEDRAGWGDGTAPKVDIVLRKGDVGFNNAEAEKGYPRRQENEWPIARTEYTKFYLTSDKELVTSPPKESKKFSKLSYAALGTLENPSYIQFTTPTFETETEITGHIVAHLNVSMSPNPGSPTPSDIDLFLTLRYISPKGKEVFYTGTAGDPVPLCKGWLRVSLRHINKDHARHREYLPQRDYFSTDVRPVIPGEVYPVDVEIWPTNVVVERGGKIILEVSSGDTQGSGIFLHNEPTDRSVERFQGQNHINFGHGDNYQPEKDIRSLSRYITTHTEDGKAVFSSAIDEAMPVTPIPDGAHFSLAYTTSTTPASISNESDITSYSKSLEPGNSPGLVISSGSVCRIVDMPPGALSPMHRTVSLDYGVVLEGTVALELDSGEKRIMKRGDVAVQRGTNHAWRNLSESGWARMLYVLLPAEKVVTGGRELGEELGDMGIRSSE